MQLLTGRDETGQFPLSLIREAGSSLTEPGATPKERLELIYEKWSDVQDACGTSRLYGGMHFSKAVPAGEQLCTGVADLVVTRAELLVKGDVSGALADLDDTGISVKSIQDMDKEVNNGSNDHSDNALVAIIISVTVSLVLIIAAFFHLKKKKEKCHSEAKDIEENSEEDMGKTSYS